MPEKKNALAELAERMRKYICEAAPNWSFRNDAEAAQRIIAELAKVEYLTCAGTVVSTVITQADRAIIISREIAEEGADNGK